MDPALWELLRSSEDDNNQEVEAIIRLRRPRVEVPGVRIVARFGDIATCRLRKESIPTTRRDRNVVSLKAARLLGPEPDSRDAARRFSPSGDQRRPQNLALTGAGVVVAIVDWGCDFDHANFKRSDGSTRLIALWDQRGAGVAVSPRPYGYGVLHTKRQINDALRADDPYDALGYHPGDADRDGSGAHGTHVMDIAAGNGLAGGPTGIAPEADLIFVHLADRGTGGLANLGDSARILEAVDFVARSVGDRPWVINLSVGRHGGPHDGCTLVELALDHALRAAPGRFIVQSSGNYFDKSIHASGILRRGQVRALALITDEADLTPNELEVWYGGRDEFMVRTVSPVGLQSPWVRLGDQAEILEGDRIVGHLYHRDRDPNNHDNHIDLFLYPWASAGRWIVALRAIRVRDGVFHAWLERDEECAHCQAHFEQADADSLFTTGTIANGRMPVVVGAYDAHSPIRGLASFSSAGPTRRGQLKPELVAPGVQVLAARSAPRGSRSSRGMLARKSGTSMAAPHVTGAVALCLQGAPRPFTSTEIRALLLRSAEHPSSNGTPWSRFGCGYLDIGRLVAEVSALGEISRASRIHRSTAPKQRDYCSRVFDSKEPKVLTDPELAARVSLGPDKLYREIVYRQEGPLSGWIDKAFTVLARPGESLRTPPEAGDVLVRIALGEPGLGHVAVLSDPSLTPQRSLDPMHVRSERGGPGLYATVVEGGAFPHTRSDRFARRVLDQSGQMPPGQVLLRPKPSIETGSLIVERHAPATVVPGRYSTANDIMNWSDGDLEAGAYDVDDFADETNEYDGGPEGFEALANDLDTDSVTPYGLEDFISAGAQEISGEGVSMSLPVQTRESERCKENWLKKLARLSPEITDALEIRGVVWDEGAQRAIDLGVRDVNLLTDFAYFSIYGVERGFCPIPRGHPDAVDWIDLRKEVAAKLVAPLKPLEQGGPSVCVGRRENRTAAPEPEVAPRDLTGRYEYTMLENSRPDGALALNQAGRHVEFSIAPFAKPFDPATDRPVRFYAGDLDAMGNFLAVNKDNAEGRLFLRVRGTELDLVAIDTGARFGVARRVESRSTLFPVALRSISRSLDKPAQQGSAGAIGQLVDIAKKFFTTVHVGPFLYRQEHLPLQQNQRTYLRQRFTSREFDELVRGAAAATGHRSADASVRESLRSEIERFVDRTVNERTNGVHRSDYPLAREIVRRTLSQRGFSNGNRQQTYLAWIQLLAELSNRPIGADSVLGIRPLESEVDTYVYEVDLEVAEAAFFIGGGVGEMSVRQVAPTAWPNPITLRVWFGGFGGSVKVSTDRFGGQATSPFPWAQRDFVGRIERVKGGIGVHVPGVSAEMSAGFLHIYGSELLPPLTVLEAGPQLSTAVEFDANERTDPRKWTLALGGDVGVSGLVGWTSTSRELEVLDLTQSDPEPIYAARGGGRRDVHFCFDSALLTPAARQRVRVVSALWRPFLTSPRSTMSIQGYADKAGTDAYNLELSQRRAENTLTAMRDVLDGAFALTRERTTVTGKGESGARAGGARAGAPDRRVEVRLNGLTVLVLDGE